MKKTRIIHSTEFNPWYNLALEEHLLDNVEKEEVILYLWQNDNTVVIGRNQNAWKECRCRQLEEEDGGYLARRMSGGGAVYHDLGNLNFTFLMDKEFYDLKKQLKVILNAVRKLGIEAEFSGRNDLVIGERKFSGNAFYFGSDSSLHHGTILVDSDFAKLVEYLQVSEEKIKSKGIESVRSRVINLTEEKPGLTIEGIQDVMAASFKEIYGGNPDIERINPLEYEEIEDLYDKYSSWDWRYGQTPDFDITFDKRFDWGEIEIGLAAKRGYIESAAVYSDAMEADLIEEMGKVLEGLPFNMEEIITALSAVGESEIEEEILKDVCNWLEGKSL